MLSIYKMTFFANFLKYFRKAFSEFQVHLNVNADSLKYNSMFTLNCPCPGFDGKHND